MAHITPSKAHTLLLSLKSEIMPKSNANGDKIKLNRKIPIIPIIKLTIPKVAELLPKLTFIFESFETLTFLFDSLFSDIVNYKKINKKRNFFLICVCDKISNMSKIIFIFVALLSFNSKHALSVGACNQISDYEVGALIDTVNSYGYNFDFYDVSSCLNLSQSGYVSFYSTDLTIYFDMNPVNPAFLIRSVYGGKGTCIKPYDIYEVYNQNECY